MLKDYSGRPDNLGVLAEFRLELPAFQRGIYYASSRWPGGGNRIIPRFFESIGDLNAGEGGIFLLLDVGQDDYLAIVPLVGHEAYAWLVPHDEAFLLRLGTHGKGAVASDAPLVAWAHSTNAYAACRMVWEYSVGIESTANSVILRGKKRFPELFEYLGWCSWEHFKADIDETKIVQAVNCINGGPLPIRHVLIDDGHQTLDESGYFHRKLLSFSPAREKFPNGFGFVAALRRPGRVTWLGIWLPMLGGMAGIAPESELAHFFGHNLAPVHEGGLLPQDREAAMNQFMMTMLQSVSRSGFDLVKVDFMNLPIMYYSGAEDPCHGPRHADHAHNNPYHAATDLCQALENAAEINGVDLLFCNAHNASCLFGLRRTNVVRSSEDYCSNDLRRTRHHLFEGFYAVPWLGQISWADHDMFHSGDKVAGRLMAVAKAVAGGPVYLSDDPQDFDCEVVHPLCYADGLLLRPLAPAAPLPQDLFTGRVTFFRVVAPLANDCAAVVVYHLDCMPDDSEAISCACRIVPEDYAHSTIMMQPATAPLAIPREGLLVYDWYRGTASRLSDGYRVEIEGFGDRLLILSPIRHGWAMIGRTDKYLSPAAVEVIEMSRLQLRFRSREAGCLVIWRESGSVKSEILQVQTAGDGLYQIALPPDQCNQIVTLACNVDVGPD